VPDIVKKIFSNFNGNAAITTFMSRKASRYVGELLEKIGEDNLRGMILQGRHFIEFIPPEQQMKAKAMAMPYGEIIGELQPEIVYTWLDQKNRTFFESIPGGKVWATLQLAIIKKFITS
jgi:hypothetical protein